jgi:hypothetical protein
MLALLLMAAGELFFIVYVDVSQHGQSARPFAYKVFAYYFPVSRDLCRGGEPAVPPDAAHARPMTT